MAVCHCRRPDGVPDLANDEKTRLVRGPRRKLYAIRVRPQRLRLTELDSVLRLVSGGLQRVELERHAGIRSISSIYPIRSVYSTALPNVTQGILNIATDDGSVVSQIFEAYSCQLSALSQSVKPEDFLECFS